MTHPEKLGRTEWPALREARGGAMLHFDASASDDSSLDWLARPGITASYNWITMDSGNIVPLVPKDRRAPHAGWCRSDDSRLIYRDANSFFYGLAIAATNGDVATREAKRSIAALCRTLFLEHGWPLSETWRIVSHRSQAVYGPTDDAVLKGLKKAGDRGRKNDPEGPDLAHPVMNTNEIRGMVAGMAETREEAA